MLLKKEFSVGGKPTILCNIAVCSYKWGLSAAPTTVPGDRVGDERPWKREWGQFRGVGLRKEGEKHRSTMYSK